MYACANLTAGHVYALCDFLWFCVCGCVCVCLETPEKKCSEF